MKVRLTERQASWVRQAFDGHRCEALIEKWFNEAGTAGFSVDITMSPEAWLYAAEWMFRNLYSVGGSGTRQAGSAGLKAHQRVQRAINERRLHPAFRGSSLLGTDRSVLTGWEAPGKICAFWQDCGHPSSRFVILLPVPGKYKGERVTSWQPFQPAQLSGADELADERVHVCFAHEAPEVTWRPQG